MFKIFAAKWNNCSRRNWKKKTWSWATYSGCPCLRRGVGPDGLWTSLPTSNRLYEPSKAQSSKIFQYLKIQMMWLHTRPREQDLMFLWTSTRYLSVSLDEQRFSDLCWWTYMLTEVWHSCWFFHCMRENGEKRIKRFVCFQTKTPFSFAAVNLRPYMACANRIFTAVLLALV